MNKVFKQTEIYHKILFCFVKKFKYSFFGKYVWNVISITYSFYMKKSHVMFDLKG